MDDPTRRCENDTDNETHSPGPPIPSGDPIFFQDSRPYLTAGNVRRSSSNVGIVALPATTIERVALNR